MAWLGISLAAGIVGMLGFAGSGAGAPAPSATTAADPVVVSARTPDRRVVRVRAKDAVGGLCLDLSVGSEPLQRDVRCPAPPTTASGDAFPQHTTFRAVPSRVTIVYGATSPRTAEVEVVLASGTSLRVPTRRARGYRGRYARRARFYVAVLPGSPVIAGGRALDARGRIRGGADVDPLALPATRGPVNLRSVRDERGRPARLRAARTRILDPRPGRPLHRRGALCVGVRASAPAPTPRRDPGRVDTACATEPARVVVGYSADCSTRRVVVFGVGPASLRGAALVLDDGARVPMRIVSLPARLRRPGRAVVAELRGRAAVRRLEARSATGAITLSFSGSGLTCRGR